MDARRGFGSLREGARGQQSAGGDPLDAKRTASLTLKKGVHGRMFISIKWLVMIAAAASVSVSLGGGLVMYFYGKNALSDLIEDSARADVRKVVTATRHSFESVASGVDRVASVAQASRFHSLDGAMRWAQVEAVATATNTPSTARFSVATFPTSGHLGGPPNLTRGEFASAGNPPMVLSVDPTLGTAGCPFPCARRHTVVAGTAAFVTTTATISLNATYTTYSALSTSKGPDAIWAHPEVRGDRVLLPYLRFVDAATNGALSGIRFAVSGDLNTAPWAGAISPSQTKASVLVAELHLGRESRVFAANFEGATPPPSGSCSGDACLPRLAGLPEHIQELVSLLNDTDPGTFVTHNGYWVLKEAVHVPGAPPALPTGVALHPVYAMWFRSVSDVHGELNNALAVFVVFIIIVFMFEVTVFFLEVYMVATPLMDLAASTRTLRNMSLADAATRVYNVRTRVYEVETLRKGLLLAISQLVEYKTFLPQHLFLQQRTPRYAANGVLPTPGDMSLHPMPDFEGSAAVSFAQSSPEVSPSHTQTATPLEVHTPVQLDGLDDLAIDPKATTAERPPHRDSPRGGMTRRGTQGRLMLSSVKESLPSFELREDTISTSSRTSRQPEMVRTTSGHSARPLALSETPVGNMLSRRDSRVRRVPSSTPPPRVIAREVNRPAPLVVDSSDENSAAEQEYIPLGVPGRGSGPLRSECRVRLQYAYVTTMTLKLGFLEQRLKKQTQRQFLEGFAESVSLLEGIAARHKGTLLPFASTDCCLMTMSWVDCPSPDRACRAALEARDTFSKVGIGLASGNRSSGNIGSRTYRNFAFMPSNDTHLIQAIHGFAAYSATLTCSSVVIISKETASKISSRFEAPFVAGLRYCSVLTSAVAELVLEKSARAETVEGFMDSIQKDASPLSMYVLKLASGKDLDEVEMGVPQLTDSTYDSALSDLGNIMMSRIKRVGGVSHNFFIEHHSSSLSSG